MIGLDTNVIVRYLTQDDPKQSPIATRLMEKTLSSEVPGFISLVVLAEVVSVLVSLYTVDRAGVGEVVTGLLTTEQLRVESAELVWRAKRRYEASKADFSDALVAECAVAAGCKRSVTFDRTAAATSGFELPT
ncbi:MAG TPA: type II toxin-antitoxin system VapC family toxin [Steroidobacteraceae bacterium]|nr:type II toxin-antitoxin system VapC family toxin [Steroidobacteraceae bacterium]